MSRRLALIGPMVFFFLAGVGACKKKTSSTARKAKGPATCKQLCRKMNQCSHEIVEEMLHTPDMPEALKTAIRAQKDQLIANFRNEDHCILECAGDKTSPDDIRIDRAMKACDTNLACGAYAKCMVDAIRPPRKNPGGEHRKKGE